MATDKSIPVPSGTHLGVSRLRDLLAAGRPAAAPGKTVSCFLLTMRMWMQSGLFRVMGQGMQSRIALLCLLGLTSMAMAIEIPDYKVTVRDGKFEVREYPEMTVVRTSSGDGDFMRLFRYISGENEGEQKIAMTAPVLMKNEGENAGMSFIVPREVAAAKAASATEPSAMAPGS